MTLYLFIFLFFINLTWYRIIIEDNQIKIKWLGCFYSENISITSIKSIEKIIAYLQVSRSHGYGNTFVWHAVKIKYNKSAKEHEVDFVPDDCDLFIKQVRMAINDHNIQGYLLPSSRKKITMLTIIFSLISVCCYVTSDFNHATLLGALYSVLALLVYNICKKILYKKIIYVDYYKNLEKYVIRN